jgi:hypothetical protein
MHGKKAAKKDMHKKILTATNVFLLTIAILVWSSSINKIQAQGKEKMIDSLVGTWKGSSLCQVKNSPCHDEIVVYHISKGRTADSCDILANKIVNGVEEEMGLIPFRILEQEHSIVSSAYNGQWIFKLKNDTLEGTLVARGSLFRIIKLSKVK